MIVFLLTPFQLKTFPCLETRCRRRVLRLSLYVLRTDSQALRTNSQALLAGSQPLPSPGRSASAGPLMSMSGDLQVAHVVTLCCRGHLVQQSRYIELVPDYCS